MDGHRLVLFTGMHATTPDPARRPAHWTVTAVGDPHYETLGHRYCGNCGFHLNTYFWAFTCTPDSPCRCCLQAAIERVRERAEGPTPAVHGDWMAGYASAMRDVLHAMDGGV